QSSANPNETAMLRAGSLADRTMFYRHDIAYGEALFAGQGLTTNPHAFMVSTNIPAFKLIALAAQEQIAVFFETNGVVTIQPQPARFFEVPIAGPLPEALNFIR